MTKMKRNTNMSTSGVGLLWEEERRLNVIFKDPSRSWRSNISMENLQHIQRNSLRGDSVYQEWFLLKCGGRWRERVLSSSIMIVFANEPGIHPLVRMVACWQWLSYGDASDWSDENFQILETSLDDSFKEFCIILLQEFGEEYLNRCPTNDKIKRTLQVNSNRGFPGLFASWDCKHFPWDICPMAEAGQHKGKEKKHVDP